MISSSTLIPLVWNLEMEGYGPEHKLILLWIADYGVGTVWIYRALEMFASCNIDLKTGRDAMDDLLSAGVIGRFNTTYFLKAPYFPAEIFDELIAYEQRLARAKKSARHLTPLEKARNRFQTVRPSRYKKLVELYGEMCLCCGSSSDLCVDHIKALAVGGSNKIDNLQILCRSCNTRKGTKNIDYRGDRAQIS